MKWRRIRTGIVIAGAVTLLAAVGCGPGSKQDPNNNNSPPVNNNNWNNWNNNQVNPDASVLPDSSVPGPDASTAGCDTTGFTAVNDLATYTNGFLHYQAYNSSGYPTDRLSVQIYASFGGPNTPGSYTLENGPDDNYETCGLCPLIYVYPQAGDPTKIFYADTGTVQITQIGTQGGTFAATFHNLIFREVTINPSNFHSTVVPGGDVWCINGFTFSEPIEDPGDVCAQPGSCIGDDIADFSVTSCDTGQPVSISSLMTGMNALWIVGTHEW